MGRGVPGVSAETGTARGGPQTHWPVQVLYTVVASCRSLYNLSDYVCGNDAKAFPSLDKHKISYAYICVCKYL